MSARRRVYAGLLCLAMVLALLSFAAFMAHEAGHDCVGEHCPICHMIAMHSGLDRLLTLAAFVGLLLYCLNSSRAIRPQYTGAPALVPTLISLKIRLDH